MNHDMTGLPSKSDIFLSGAELYEASSDVRLPEDAKGDEDPEEGCSSPDGEEPAQTTVRERLRQDFTVASMLTPFFIVGIPISTADALSHLLRDGLGLTGLWWSTVLLLLMVIPTFIVWAFVWATILVLFPALSRPIIGPAVVVVEEETGNDRARLGHTV